jgi:DNA-binding NarL/FixJ family response regulator
MEMTSRLLQFRSNHREGISWILSAGWPKRVVMAVGSQQRLLLMGQLLARPKILGAAVTTEAEALASVIHHRPQLLLCSDWLESGSIVSCIRSALQEVPELRVIMVISQREQPPELWAIDPLLAAMVLEHDIGGEEFPLRDAFIALARGRRYRSPSLRASRSPEPLPLQQQQPAGLRLSPREAEVWELICQGLQDRQIAEALGVTHETTRTYVKALRRKLGGGSRLALAFSRRGV